MDLFEAFEGWREEWWHCFKDFHCKNKLTAAGQQWPLVDIVD